MAAAVEEEELDFYEMDEAELRQWVEANPGRVNDRGRYGDTPLVAAADEFKSLPLVVWLLDEQGADVNVTAADGRSALMLRPPSTFSMPFWTVARTLLW